MRSSSSRPCNKAKFQEPNRKENIFFRKEKKTDMGDHRARRAYFPFASYIYIYIYIYSYSVSPPLKPSKWSRYSQVPQRVEFQPRLPVPEMNLGYWPATSQDIVLNVKVKLIYKTKPSDQQELVISVMSQYFFVLGHELCISIMLQNSHYFYSWSQ
jgi:hypothetical protein